MGRLWDFSERNTPFSRFPFCAVDALILSELAMCDVWEEGGLLRDLRFAPGPVSNGFQEKEDRRLLSLVKESPRYGPVCAGDFTRLDGEELQFAAMTFHLPDGRLFIAFRGTDRSLAGWREDCEMPCVPVLPSQTEAKHYLERIAEKYPGPVMLGGHSKGGFLSLYAAASAEEELCRRITDIYNFDGPGLSDQLDYEGLYARLGNRLHYFAARASIVSLFLTRPRDFRIIRSSTVGFAQHNPYSWHVEGADFRYAPRSSRGSRRFERVFHSWIGGLSEAEKREMVDTLFSMLRSSGAENFDRKLWFSLLRRRRDVSAVLRNAPPETKKRIRKSLSEFVKNSFRV